MQLFYELITRVHLRCTQTTPEFKPAWLLAGTMEPRVVTVGGELRVIQPTVDSAPAHEAKGATPNRLRKSLSLGSKQFAETTSTPAPNAPPTSAGTGGSWHGGTSWDKMRGLRKNKEQPRLSTESYDASQEEGEGLRASQTKVANTVAS